MKTATSRLLVVALTLTCGAASAAGTTAPQVGHAGVPPWVDQQRLDPGSEIPTEKLRDGIYILLFERQIRVGSHEVETFERFVRRIVAQPGVDAASRISIEFDPTYQTLDIHEVRIRRGDEDIDALALENIKLLQRETDLEYGIYDGRITASLFLEDVRVGDVVDYSFTVRGQNPVFGGRYMDHIWTSGRHPYRHLRFRLLWPSGRDLFIEDHGESVDPEVRDLGEYEEYVWELSNTDPVSPDSDLPDWYYWHSWTQLSEFEGWADVAAWGASVFSRARAPESVRTLAARIEADHETPGERLLAALRFVQDEIRYLGIEIGPNSHRPHSPDVVMRRRFGDCKDKSLLLTTLLGELGIDAAPALVNTDLRTHVESWHPSPYAFDHAIVRAKIGSTVFWVDPTRSYQGGGLSGWPYETTALTLSPGSTGLERVPQRDDDGPTTRVEYDFDSPDLDSPTTLVITTVATQEAASRLRSYFTSTSRDEIRRGYLEYYAQKYDDIESIADIEYEDDRAADLVRVRERYRIDNFWKQLDDGRWKAWYYPMEIRSRISAPDTPSRSMPIGRTHPDSIEVSMHATLPTDFDLEDATDVIADPAFRFRRQKIADTRDIRLFYEYESLSDSVSLEEVPTYLEHMDQAWDLSTYSLWTRRGVGSSPARRRIELALLSPVLVLLLASPLLRMLARSSYVSKGSLERSVGFATWAHRLAGFSFRPLLARAAAAVQLSHLKVMSREFPEAEELAIRALRRTHGGGRLADAVHCEALYTLAILRARQRRFDEAQDYLTRAEHAAELLPAGDPEQRALRNLIHASIHANSGSTEGAEEAIREAEDLTRGNRYIAHAVASTRAEVLEADGLRDLAGELLRRNLRTAEETFGPGHFFAQEARRQLREFQRRQTSAEQPSIASSSP